MTREHCQCKFKDDGHKQIQIDECGHHAGQRREAKAEQREADAALAMGMTGPGNTLKDCVGYSAACVEIAKAIREAK